MLSAADATTWFQSKTCHFRAVYMLRRGSIEPTPPQIPEVIASIKVRRVPLEIINWDPFQCFPWSLSYSKLPLGTEVEVQYRFHSLDPFTWWRGFISSITRYGVPSSSGSSVREFGRENKEELVQV